MTVASQHVAQVSLVDCLALVVVREPIGLSSVLCLDKKRMPRRHCLRVETRESNGALTRIAQTFAARHDVCAEIQHVCTAVLARFACLSNNSPPLSKTESADCAVMADFGQTDFGQPSLASPFW